MSQDLTEGWLINNRGPYGINAILGGILTGYYNATLDNGDLIVQNIMMNDKRNATEFVCVIYELPLPGEDPPGRDDIIEESDPTYLYVAGE